MFMGMAWDIYIHLYIGIKLLKLEKQLEKTSENQKSAQPLSTNLCYLILKFLDS